jgi:hypothetical protein
MSFSPTLFLSNINSKGGLSRPNRFQVILPIPTFINRFIENSLFEQLLNFPNTLVSDVTNFISGVKSFEDVQSRTSNSTISRYLSLQCESAELPGKNLLTSDVKIYGPTFKVPYQKQFNDINLTFVCTNDFYEKKLFDTWIDCIMSPSTNNLRYPKDNSTRYMTDIRILQYDDFIKQIYAVKLIDSFPIGVSAQQLSWSDDNFHRLTVQFAYQKYEPLLDTTYDIASVATSLFGSNGIRLFRNFFNISL